jgi:hypothetical protein
MTTIEQAGGLVGSAPGFLDRERIIAKAGFSRWLVPPAALCIHLCTGMAYGFSVFWLPLSRGLGVTQTRACPDMRLLIDCKAAPGDYACPCVSNMAASSASRAGLPAQTTNWKAGK